jgi:AbrB family looped-hinge helix DNA binding protein
MIFTTVSEKGWVVIPKEIRDKYGIKKGKKVAISDWDGVIYVVPIADDPIAHGRGLLKGGRPWSELIADKRRELEEEERGLPPPRALE